jgi:hypothetical protein
MKLEILLVGYLLAATGAFAATQSPVVGGCPVFPPSNIWNVPVDSLPVAHQSAAYVNSTGSKAFVRTDTTMPINIVQGRQPLVILSGPNVPESDPGGYPVPDDVKIEPGGMGADRHTVIVDKDHCILYEIYSLSGRPGDWHAGSGAKWDLNSNALRPYGWTSADAAGLAILPGILRYEEMLSGHIDHALRFTAPNTLANSFAWPGRHYASRKTDPNLPMMGQRFRLKASVDISGFSPHIQVILRALQKYGMMLADNGLAWSFQADPDPRWDQQELLTLRRIVGNDFEAVDVSVLESDPDSGVALSPPPAGVVVTDLLGRKTSVPFGAGICIRDGRITANCSAQ